MSHYEIVIHSEPVAKARPRLGRGRIFTPRTTELAEHRIRETWCTSHLDVRLTGPVMLHVVVYLPQPKSVPKRARLTARPVKRPDVDNYAKTVFDALRGVAYADDGQIVQAYLAKTYTINGEVPGWKIGIFPMEDKQ